MMSLLTLWAEILPDRGGTATLCIGSQQWHEASISWRRTTAGWNGCSRETSCNAAALPCLKTRALPNGFSSPGKAMGGSWLNVEESFLGRGNRD